MDVQYASNGKGNLGVTLGAIGTGLGLLDGGANIVGKLLGANGMGTTSPDDKPVTRYEAGLMKQTTDMQIENAMLKSQLYTDGQINGVNAQIAQQTAINAASNANMNALGNQLAQLTGRFNRLTDEFVPNDHVAPGWGNANVQPAPPLPPYPYPPYLYPPFVPPVVPPVPAPIVVQTGTSGSTGTTTTPSTTSNT